MYKSEVLAWQIIEKPEACVKRHMSLRFLLSGILFFEAKGPTSDTGELLSCLEMLPAIYSSLNPSPTTSFDSMITRKDFGSIVLISLRIPYICLLLQAHIMMCLSSLE